MYLLVWVWVWVWPTACVGESEDSHAAGHLLPAFRGSWGLHSEGRTCAAIAFSYRVSPLTICIVPVSNRDISHGRMLPLTPGSSFRK